MKSVLAVIALMFLNPTLSFATTITYDFTARLDVLSDNANNLFPNAVLHSMFPVRITIDTSLPDTTPGSSIQGIYEAVAPPSDFEFTLDGRTVSTDTFRFNIVNGATIDQLHVDAGSPNGVNGLQGSLAVSLDSDDTTFLSSKSFPTTLDLSKPYNKSLLLDVGVTSPNTTFLSATLLNAQVSSDALPEPGSIVLVTTGLVAVLIKKRRFSVKSLQEPDSVDGEVD